MFLLKFCILLGVLVESEGTGESFCECAEDGDILNCGNLEGRTQILIIQGCDNAKTLYGRGMVIGIKDRRGIRLDKVTLYQTTMTCEQVYRAVPTLKATLNGDDCPDAPVYVKTPGPRPPVKPAEPADDDNDDGNDDDDGHNDDDENDDDNDNNNDDDGNDEEDGNSDDDNGNDDDNSNNNTTLSNNNNTTQTTTNVTTPSQSTIAPRIIVLEGNVTLYGWLIGISFTVLFIGGGWLAIIRIRARCTVSRERRVQVPEVSSTTSEDCETTYVLREVPRSPRRRRGSMESVKLYAVDEL